jgi:uncharacterized protein YbcV (DUF1398 family)
MKQETIAVMHEVATKSDEGTITFPEAVRKLVEAGVERYHTDLCRAEHVYYMPGGESHVERMPEFAWKVANDFSDQGVDDAVRTIQRGEILYMEFVRRVMDAGCVSWWVLLDGRQTQYFGRKGEIHVERFPATRLSGV